MRRTIETVKWLENNMENKLHLMSTTRISPKCLSTQKSTDLLSLRNIKRDIESKEKIAKPFPFARTPTVSKINDKLSKYYKIKLKKTDNESGMKKEIETYLQNLLISMLKKQKEAKPKLFYEKDGDSPKGFMEIKPSYNKQINKKILFDNLD